MDLSSTHQRNESGKTFGHDFQRKKAGVPKRKGTERKVKRFRKGGIYMEQQSTYREKGGAACVETSKDQ